MELKKNDRINLKIDSCSADGSGIGRYNGMAIFVPAAAVGDEITAHILKVKKNYAFAKIENILVPSADRIKPKCPVYLKCGGCAFSHINYEAEKKIKAEHVAECLHRIGGVFPELEEIIGGNDCRYRNKAQFPVALENGEMRAGFYSPHSHRVVHCPDCLLQPPEFEGILDVFARYVRENGVSVYDETAHTGLLRHIYLRKGSASGEIMVCAVVNGNYLPAEEKLVEALLEKECAIKSIILNTNTKKTNVILGDRCRTLWGSDYITDILCSLKFRISPLSFYQVNRDQAERLYNKAAEYAGLTGSETVLDLYCGAGTIGLSMASKAKEIIGVEIVPQAVEDAKINAAENGITNARFICGDASQAAALLREQGICPDVIILDPPRKGCGEDLLKTAAQMEPQRIVYVSCDPATLARDCAPLKTIGYEAVKAAPVDMFPRTGHVETVVLLSRETNPLTVEVRMEVETGEVKEHPTYKRIQEYVQEKYGFKVHTAYIAEVKRMVGLDMHKAPNAVEQRKHEYHPCPPEKVEAIKDALRHFGLIAE